MEKDDILRMCFWEIYDYTNGNTSEEEFILKVWDKAYNKGVEDTMDLDDEI